MDTLFSNVTVVTMDEELRVLFSAFVGVTDGKISYLSQTAPEERPQRIINGEGMVLMPGLINCHTHLAMTPMRGYADDLNLSDWLNDWIFPAEERLDGRTVRAATLLGLAECLRFGTTSVSDMYFFCDETAQAVAESGIKANLSRSTVVSPEEEFCFDTNRRCQEAVALKEKWHGYDNGRIRVEGSVHAEYTSDYRLWEALSEYCLSEGLRMHIHLSETQAEHEGCKERHGLTPAQVLDCHHMFDMPGMAAHCVWLEPEDMALLAKRKISAVHCPVSNFKLGSGRAKVMEMIRAGMNVALGTDSTASNNNLDLFEEIKAAALAAKATGDPRALPAQAAVMMATVCGARAQGREAECGMIKPGMDADLILLDFTQPHLMPCHNVLSHLAYAVRGSDVVMTMVRGKILYAAGEYKTIDLNAVVRELADYAMPKLFSRQEAK